MYSAVAHKSSYDFLSFTHKIKSTHGKNVTTLHRRTMNYNKIHFAHMHHLWNVALYQITQFSISSGNQPLDLSWYWLHCYDVNRPYFTFQKNQTTLHVWEKRQRNQIHVLLRKSAFSSFLRIFPDADLGMTSTNSTPPSSCLYSDRFEPICAWRWRRKSYRYFA